MNIKHFMCAIAMLIGMGTTFKVSAQQKVIYYWDFDNFTGLSAAGSPSLILPLHSNWSTLDSTKGFLSYVPALKVSSKYATYWDVVPGEASDTFNVKKGGKKGLATGNNELRFRNPSDSMEALITVPTTHYKNITIKYGLERTTSGQGAENFDYSTDGGVTWKTSGLSIKHDTALAVFSLVTVSLAADAAVNNNATGFIFRIKFTTPNSTTSGNNRVDNLSVEGDTDIVFGTPLYKISQVTPFNATTGAADSLSNTTLAKGYIKGVVMSPSFSASYLQFSLADATGAITVFTSAIKYYTPKVGDSIIVHGYLSQYHGVMEYDVDTIAKLTSGTWLETPTVLTTMTEPNLSQLVELKNVHVVSGWATTGTSLTVNLSDGTNTFQLYITAATGIIGTAQPTGNFNVFGIESVYGSAPYTTGYQLEPRSIADIQLISSFAAKPLYTIAQVTPFNATTGAADSLANTTLAKGYLKGVVMSPSFSTSYLQFSLADATGAITVFTSAIKYYTPKVGDSILVHGYLSQYHGVMEYDVDTIATLTTGTKLETPTVLTAMTEQYLSQLVELKNVHVVSGWATTGTSLTVNVSDGTNTYQLYITSATGIIGTAQPAGNFNVFGIESVYGSAPYTSGYQLEPRFIADIQLISSFVAKPLYTIGQVTPFNATTGIADSLANLSLAKGYLKGVVMSPSFSTSYLQFSLADATGAITVFTSAIKYYTPNVGDSVLVHGYISQFHGVMEYDVDTIVKLTAGTKLETPTVLTAMTETYLSQLVELKNVHVVSGWATTGTSLTVNVSDGTNTYQLYITSTTGIIGTAQPAGNFNVFGIESLYGSTPFTTGYQLEPRFIADIQLIGGPSIKPLYSIGQVTPFNATTGLADSLSNITLAKGYLKGVVMSPSFSASYLQFSLADATGAVTIFTSAIKYYTPKIGDSILVHGYINQYNGVMEYDVDTIAKLTSGTWLETPTALTTMSEKYLSQLVEFKNMHIISGWATTGSSLTVSATNGPDTIQLYITSATGIIGTAAPKGKFNVFGIESEYKSAAPYNSGYQLEPRFITDIQPIPVKTYTIAQVEPYNSTTGIADSLGTYCFLKGVVQSPNLTGSSLVEGFAVQDNTGGISVEALAKFDGYTPIVGDSIIMKGTVVQSNGLTVFSIDSISKRTGGSAISPVVVTTLDEATESKLVTMKTYALTTPSQWDTTKAVNGLITVQATQFGTSNTITMIIAKGTNLYKNSAAPTGGHFDVTGISSQNDPSAPFLSDYVLIPRSTADIVASSGIQNIEADKMNISVFPNPASDFVNINASFPMTQITITDMLGKTVAVVVPGPGMAKINIANFNKGIYILKVDNETNSYTTRFIKE